MKQVSVIIPVFNQLKITISLLDDLLRTRNVEMEIIIVDDGSQREPIKILRKLFPSITLLTNQQNQGFAKSINKGITNSTSNLILLLNNDIKLPNPNWLNMMLITLNQNNWDMTAPALGRLSLPNYNYLPGEVKSNAKINKKEFVYTPAWCTIIKRAVIDKIGMMPTEMGTGFFEDALFCYRAKRAGFKWGITEGTQVEHLYHTTFKAEGYNLAKEYQEKRKIFLDMIRGANGNTRV